MRRKQYSCDGGSIMIGTPDCRACFINYYGDGTHNVYVCKRGEKNTDGWRFMGSVEGADIRVYDYDALKEDECKDDTHVLFKLSGRYGVFVHNGNVVLEHWRDVK